MNAPGSIYSEENVSQSRPRAPVRTFSDRSSRASLNSADLNSRSRPIAPMRTHSDGSSSWATASTAGLSSSSDHSSEATSSKPPTMPSRRHIHLGADIALLESEHGQITASNRPPSMPTRQSSALGLATMLEGGHKPSAASTTSSPCKSTLLLSSQSSTAPSSPGNTAPTEASTSVSTASSHAWSFPRKPMRKSGLFRSPVRVKTSRFSPESSLHRRPRRRPPQKPDRRGITEKVPKLKKNGVFDAPRLPERQRSVTYSRTRRAIT